jgi:hypothetical protein
VQDWDGGLVTGNIFTAWGDSTLNNNYAISANGNMNDVSYTGNIVNITSGGPLVLFLGGAIQERIQFTGNDILTGSTGQLLSYSLASNAGFGNNYFYSTRPQSQWFVVNGVNNSSLDLYRTTAGDTTSTAGKRNYADPNRTIETYLTYLGYSTTDMDSFVAVLCQQSKFAGWNLNLGAAAINNYIRGGFASN